MDKEITKSNGQLKQNNDETQLTAYNEAVTELKTAILQSQLRVAKAANSEMLSLYYAIGKYLSDHTRKDAWGTNAIDVISRNLQKSLPGLRGFSPGSMRKMRQFYEQWSELTNCSPTASKTQHADNESNIAITQLSSLICSPTASKLKLQDFFSLSFTHHCEILSQAKTLEERIFYIHQAAVQRWDKYTLRDNLRADLFHHQGKMPNNFMQTIPERQQALKAIEMFKDEYLLDYINVEELGCREEDIDERVIENSIVHNIKNFIMTFGKSFSYLGHQVHYEKLGEDHWVDLLFFNRELRSLVVVELKRGAFKPSYLGQLQTYLRILDDDERLQGENPSVGIILCRDANRAYVEYVLQDYRKPMGVATYQVTIDKLKSLLPNEDEMRKLLTSNEEDAGLA
jgi:predicted nuclease of restriction endonuclease-like (RecB) superfamily